MTEITRRNVLGVAAGTMATAVGSPADVAMAAAPPAVIDEADLALFVKISAALTGIAPEKLAPTVDPIKIKREYYVQASRDDNFQALMRIVRADPTNPAAAAQKIMGNADPNIKFLGRSIILVWYLGVWHGPAKLQSKSPDPFDAKVVSAAAYTQGWTWRVAQAHPMGYSELRFGYWSDEPLPLNVITG